MIRMPEFARVSVIFLACMVTAPLILLSFVKFLAVAPGYGIGLGYGICQMAIGVGICVVVTMMISGMIARRWVRICVLMPTIVGSFFVPDLPDVVRLLLWCMLTICVLVLFADERAVEYNASSPDQVPAD